LLPGGNGSKVDKSHAAVPASPATAAALEVPLTTRLRELIQQLGEAINEAVTENEQIAGVVQDIRRHGFDVLLMLEASIALNDLSAKEDTPVEVPAGSSAEQSFTQNDLSFLRQLRISVDGENLTSEKHDDPGPAAI
jgi:uncharacterized protein (UPF0335 family)